MTLKSLYVRAMKNILVFDCETTGLPPKGAKYQTDFLQFPRIVQLSWDFNGFMNDFIIKPDGWTIPEEATKIHGITQERAEREGVPIAEVLSLFWSNCFDAKKLVGHNIYFDSSVIKSEALRLGSDEFVSLLNDAMDKTKRICTMMKTIKLVGARQKDSNRMKFPTLEETYAKLFNGETFDAHNSAEDVRATLRCFEELIKLEIIKL